MGYTADQIVVEGIPVEHLEDMEFVERAGEHGCLTLGGYVRAEDGEPLLFHMPQYSPLTIRAEGQDPFFRNHHEVSGHGKRGCEQRPGDCIQQKHFDGSGKTLPLFSGYGDDI